MAETSQQAPFSVNGRTAIITGAGSGINYCFAKLLLERNCNVVIADLALRPEAQALVDQYSSNPRAIFVKTDVIDWAQLSSMFDITEKEFGGADIVCPGAGIYEPHWTNFWHPPGTKHARDPIQGTQGIGHYALFDINTTHPIRVTQLALQHWLNPSQKSGKASPLNPKRVVHVSSIAGQQPGFHAPMYNASKHAINGFIRSLAPLDAALGVRVNGVAPGVIKTPLWTEHPEKLQMVDQGTDAWVMPEEVAEVMLRCCEDEGVVGGSVMEVLKDQVRNVDWRDDPGPQGPGATASNHGALVKEIFGWLREEGWGVPA